VFEDILAGFSSRPHERKDRRTIQTNLGFVLYLGN
jgi:hypothetical protein